MFSGLSLKDLFKRKVELGGQFFSNKIIIVMLLACHTRFAVFFPLPSCCVSSLLVVVIQHVHVGGPEYNISHTVIPNNHNPQYYIIIF